MAKQTINIGSGELAGDGESIRSAFGKINDNFDELYTNGGGGAEGPTGPQGEPGAVGPTGPAGTGGTSISTSDTAPTDPEVGDLWYDTVSGRTYIYYDSGWVDSSPPALGVQGPTGPQGDPGVAGPTGPSDFTSIASHILPSDDLTYDLGSTSTQWRSLYVGTSTVYFGGIPLRITPEGGITVNDVPVSGESNTGDITFNATAISAPNDAVITVEGKNSNSIANAKLTIDPNNAIAKLESITSDSETFFSGNGYWTTATWTATQFGYGELVFTDADLLNTFLNSSTNSWNSGQNKRISWNDGSSVAFSGWGYGSGTVTITTSEFPTEGPIEVTEIRFDWDNISRVAVDSDDYQELQIQGRGIPIEINSTGDVNIEAGDDLRLTGRDIVSIRNRATDEPVSIVTDYDNSEHTWEFNPDASLRLPSGGIIRETVVTDNPTIELEPADADGVTQKLIIKGGGPTYSNTENGITVSVNNTLTYAQGDTVYISVNTGLAQGTTLYWWVDNYSPSTQFTPDTGELVLDEFGNAYFDFFVNDGLIPFRVYVAETLYDAFATNNWSVSVEMNALVVDNSLHLHLTTGDLTETSIFLGTDDHNVRTKPNGDVEITAFNYIGETSKVWKFGNNAKLTFPSPDNNDLPAIEFPIPEFEGGTAGIGLAPGGVFISVLDSGWIFTPELTGEGTVPPKLIFPDGTEQLTAWAGGRVVYSPSFSIGAPGDRFGDIAFDSSYIYYCFADYTDGQSNIWKRVSWSNDTW